jgi:hypothetical protein
MYVPDHLRVFGEKTKHDLLIINSDSEFGVSEIDNIKDKSQVLKTLKSISKFKKRTAVPGHAMN